MATHPILQAVFTMLDTHDAYVAQRDRQKREAARAQDTVLRKTGADFVSDEFRNEVVEALVEEG